MKNILIIMTFTALISCNRQKPYQSKYDLSYQKGDNVCVLRFKDQNEICFIDGYDPAISPDGHRLAYTKSNRPGEEFLRYIVVIDLDSKKEIKLNVNNDNYYGATWSPDNSHIAFNIFMNDHWRIGLIKSDNSGLSIIGADTDTDLFEPTWTSDSKFIVVHDMDSIFKYDLKGNIVKTIDIYETFGRDYYMTSFTRFIFTPDNRFIIFNCGTDEIMKNDVGPLEAIFTYNTKSKEILRLTPRSIYAFDLNTGDDRSVIFAGSGENDSLSNIYRVDLAGKNLGLIHNNGSRPTMSKE